MTFVHHQALQLRASLDQYAPYRCTAVSPRLDWCSLFPALQGFSEKFSRLQSSETVLERKPVRPSGPSPPLHYPNTASALWPLCPPEGAFVLREARNATACSCSKLSNPSKDKSGAKCQLNPTDSLFSGFLDPLVLVILTTLWCL